VTRQSPQLNLTGLAPGLSQEKDVRESPVYAEGVRPNCFADAI